MPETALPRYRSSLPIRRTPDRDEPILWPGGAPWDRYRTGQLGAAQLRLVRSALEAYLAQFPEFARVCVLSLAHDGGGSFTGKVLTTRDDSEELGILEAFWQIASKASRANYTIVSVDGTSFGGPFLLRRSRLLGLAPSLPIPLGRYRLEAHFDLAAVLSNWNRAHEFTLDLWAARYGIPGPRETDTAQAIRDYLSAGAIQEATAVAQARLEAIHTLYQRLGPAPTPPSCPAHPETRHVPHVRASSRGRQALCLPELRVGPRGPVPDPGRGGASRRRPRSAEPVSR